MLKCKNKLDPADHNNPMHILHFDAWNTRIVKKKLAKKIYRESV
jgi:hypothetical protein